MDEGHRGERRARSRSRPSAALPFAHVLAAASPRASGDGYGGGGGTGKGGGTGSGKGMSPRRGGTRSTTVDGDRSDVDNIGGGGTGGSAPHEARLRRTASARARSPSG